MLRELELAEVVSLAGMRAEAGGEREEQVREAPASNDSPPASNLKPIDSMSWPELRDAVRSCVACGLCRGRKQAVFGVGAEAGPWLFVGEGPGADEDE